MLAGSFLAVLEDSDRHGRTIHNDDDFNFSAGSPTSAPGGDGVDIAPRGEVLGHFEQCLVGHVGDLT